MDVRTHRFSKHPFTRPALFIRDLEIGQTPVRITAPLRPQDVVVARATQARINGKDVPVHRLGRIFARTTWDVVNVDLSNEGASASFSVHLAVAEVAHLVGVEKCFQHVARQGRLDMRALEDFIEAGRQFKTAIGYCDGICEYFYGVLAKERVADTSLPFPEYRAKFNRAAAILGDFQRPLADLIGALIAFHFNHYRLAAGLARSSRVGAVATEFERRLRHQSAGRKSPITADDSVEKLLTDLQTERILSWCVLGATGMSNQIDEMESLLRHDVTELDRPKLRVLLAGVALATGDTAGAKRYARELANDPTFGAWAERILGGNERNPAND